jgi:glycolate oxidase
MQNGARTRAEPDVGFRAGIIPSGLEFMERDAIDWALKYLDGVNISIKDEVQAHLLVELDGNDPTALYKDAESLADLLMSFDCDEILFADTAQQKDDLWKLRRRVAEAVKSNSIYKEEDTVLIKALVQ